MSDTQELIGRVFDSRYQITELIGRGGMGVVYKAIHIAMNQVVALKVLGKGMSGDDKNVQRFYQEARASSRLKHPNSIKVFDFGRSEEGHLYLAMEFLEGNTLTQLLRQERVLGVRRALAIGRQIAKSLGEAHLNGLVHRDLKPDNVFITRIYGEEDFVKVLDFGIAKFQEGTPDHENLTQAGLVCGTPLYISPEQALGRNLDGRSDLYSLGVILYEGLSGRPPFRADSPIALVMRHIHDSPPPMTDHNPGLVIPQNLRDLIYRLLEKDRDKRPATSEEVLKEMDAIVAAGDFPETPSRDVVEMDPIGKPLGKTRIESPVSDGAELDHEESTQFINRNEPVQVQPEAPTTFLARDAAMTPRGTRMPQVSQAVAASDQTTMLPAPDELPTRVGDIHTISRAQIQRGRQEPQHAHVWLWIVLALGGVGALVTAGGFVLGWFGDRTGTVEAAQPAATGDRKAAPPATPSPSAAAPTPAPAEPAPTPAPAPAAPVAAAATPGPRGVSVDLDTVPAGASVTVGNEQVGKTPYTLQIREDQRPVAVQFDAPGHRPLKVTLDPKDVVAGGNAKLRYEMEREASKMPPPPTQVPIVVKGPPPRPAPAPAPGGGTKAAKKPKLNWDEE
ncbi:MAG: serine/threonine protein kinase [Deltaproteobacteria bacterium]|nr:serine/threonine protein kinase [Deltaproteobacteria bacterium]